ncbi:hypothetical protein ACFPM0_14050 [Pseudonocardia sulfidoxydans]|uniref:hypothetical protein n=1 Tax=Pseudonocardia sulfidoxydans TaxID=54011 RepID=UPI0036170FFF
MGAARSVASPDPRRHRGPQPAAVRPCSRRSGASRRAVGALLSAWVARSARCRSTSARQQVVVR